MMPEAFEDDSVEEATKGAANLQGLMLEAIRRTDRNGCRLKLKFKQATACHVELIETS